MQLATGRMFAALALLALMAAGPLATQARAQLERVVADAQGIT